MDPHLLLGVKEGADLETIGKRYKHLAKRLHPDKHHQDPSFAYLFSLLNKANASLTDTSSRTKPPPTTENVHPSPENASDTTLANPLLDLYFRPPFQLEDFFGDVSIPERRPR